jgi:hypothetical protein
MTSAAAGSIWVKCIEEKIDAQQQLDERVLAVRRRVCGAPGRSAQKRGPNGLFAARLWSYGREACRLPTTGENPAAFAVQM